jgi:deoxyribose-phosphate aldolase
MTFGFEVFAKEVEQVAFPKLEQTVADIKSKIPSLRSSKEELRKLVTYIDLTTLSGDDTRSRVEALVDKALAPTSSQPDLRCGAVCVYPARVADVTRHLKQLNKQLNVASVAGGFPSGQYLLITRLLEIQLAVKDGATEIDTVINRAAALDGDWELVYDELKQMKRACDDAHLKTILATGELKNNENIYKASFAAMLSGSDFIKTSTGKETVNATLEVAYVMCLAIRRYFELTGRRVGFKPAGGLRTIEDALGYRILIEEVLGKEWLTPELFRIGASSLLDVIVKEL